MSNNHPSYRRLAAFVQAHGSTATTLRGVLAAAHRLLDGADLYPTRRVFVSEWRAAQEDRKADPDAKRARVDRKFRRKYLAQLRKLESELCVTPATDAQSKLDEIARLREVATGKSWSAPLQFALLPIDDYTADDLDAKVVRRGRDWTVRPTYGKWSHLHKPGVSYWKKTITRAVNITYVTSWGLIEARQTLRCRIHLTDIDVVLPAGHYWDIDQHGLRAVHEATGDDYHVSAADVRLGADHIAAQIVVHRETRRAQRRLEYIQSQPDSLRVCYWDSLVAGNCAAGTESFCRRHNLDMTRHYTAAELLRISNGDAMRVKMVVQAAARREAREMTQGYCVIADHRGHN